MQKQFLDISTQIETDQYRVVLIIKYSNFTKEDLYVSPISPTLTLLDERGNELPYIGPMAKRAPLKISDYIRLHNGETYTRQVGLSEQYQFKAGVKYTVNFPGGYFDPLTDHYFDGPPAIASFEIKRPNSQGQAKP